MAKSDITREQARAVIDNVAKEIGLIVVDTSGFVKIQSPNTKHRMYVQRSAALGRIDTTTPAFEPNGVAVPGTKQLSAPNGSVTCNVEPTLEHLEYHLRRLCDASLGVQVPNKPRPFAASKQQTRKPKALEMPEEDEPVVVPEGGHLKDRLARLAERSRIAKINRHIENDPTGMLTFAEAEAIVDGRVDAEDMEHRASAADRDILAAIEAGIEINS
jgi:hypothetical protein